MEGRGWSEYEADDRRTGVDGGSADVRDRTCLIFLTSHSKQWVNNKNTMNKPDNRQPAEIWRELAERACLEQDHAKRMALSQQFDRVLAQDEASKKKLR
jgi:hypothetical protein